MLVTSLGNPVAVFWNGPYFGCTHYDDIPFAYRRVDQCGFIYRAAYASTLAKYVVREPTKPGIPTISGIPTL